MTEPKVTRIYFYYHHLNPHFPSEQVCEAIMLKDWETFKKIYDTWGTGYLPSYVSVFIDQGDDREEIIIDEPMCKEIFELIDDGDCECG